jgi:hypothetical protein
MCSRARHTSCRARCQHRDTPLPSLFDAVAIVPERMTSFVDLAADAAPAIPVGTDTDYILVPPSPPPWDSSAFSRL